jgi:uncharacterized protein (DUF362 family)
MTNNAVWIEAVQRTPESVAQTLEAGLGAVGRLPRTGARWAIKLNLTYPTYLPGLVNSPVFMEGLCQWASDHGVRLIFVEGDGGHGGYSAQDAFDGNGVSEIAKRYGAECASVSEKPWEWRETEVQGRQVKLPYSPFFRRRGYDRFITAPLFKNHIITIVTLGMKNLWGCIPDAFRVYYHHLLDHGIVALFKELRPDFSIFDGIVGLRGQGPMDGKPVDLNLVMVSSDVGAGEIAALEIMGIPPTAVRHLTIAQAEGLAPDLSQINWLVDAGPFKRRDFILERCWLNYLSIMLGKSPRLIRLVYHSCLTDTIHAVVNRLRGDTAQTRLIKAEKAGIYNSIYFRDR